MKKLVALLLTLLLVFVMAGCSDKGKQQTPETTPEPTFASAEADVSGSSVVGETPRDNEATAESDSPVIATYLLSSMIENGEEVPIEQFAEIQIVLREDGTGTYGMEQGMMDITWTLEGTQYTFISMQMGPDYPLILTVEGDTLVTEVEGSVMTFQKQ